LSIYLPLYCKVLFDNNSCLIELRICDLSKTYFNGVRALKDVQTRAEADREFTRASTGGFECSD
jgi:hypothetical protein